MIFYFSASCQKSNKTGTESEANCQISSSPTRLPDKDNFLESESQNSQPVTSGKKRCFWSRFKYKFEKIMPHVL